MATCLSTALKRSYFHHTVRICQHYLSTCLSLRYISHLWISYGDPQISLWFGAQNPWWKSPGPFLDLKNLPGCLDENFFQRNDGVAGVKPWRCWDNFHNESCFLVDFGVFLRGGCWVVRYTRQMLGKKESRLKYANFNLWVKWADRTKGRVNWAGRTETSWVNFNKNKHVVLGKLNHIECCGEQTWANRFWNAPTRLPSDKRN